MTNTSLLVALTAFLEEIKKNVWNAGAIYR
jgi:hypothetical protein